MHAVLVGAPLFGEDDYERELRAFMLEYTLADRVHFLGFQDDIAACMKAVDVVTHTSIMPEPFGRVIIEDILSKRPVVATRAGGVTDIVEDGENGILCSPGDAAELARILEKLKGNAHLRDRLVDKGFQNATMRFGTRRYVESVEKILSDVAGRAQEGLTRTRSSKRKAPAYAGAFSLERGLAQALMGFLRLSFSDQRIAGRSTAK